MTSTMTLPNKPQTAKKPCGCGCDHTESECCRLDCLSKPRFFCGQLLTDQDMTALVEWTQNKNRLMRYRHGWGVVCGLDVHCDPMTPASVIVTPGYAIGCCGDDIIVCEEASVDLSSFCRTTTDRCSELAPPGSQVDATSSAINFGGLSVPASEVRVVDLYLRYKEVPSDPITALGRGMCHQTVSCEYTRSRESYALVPEAATQLEDPVQAAAKLWSDGYEKCLEVLEHFLTHFPSLQSQGTTNSEAAKEVRDWLLAWVQNHHLSQFCFVRDWICSAPVLDFLKEEFVVRILFWLVQDCRNQFLHCECRACTAEEGVLLSRIWLRSEGKPRAGCRVLRIDAYPPHRRPVHTDCWPAPLGSINLARVLWHRLPEACSILSSIGVDVSRTPVEFEIPGTLSELLKSLQCSPVVDCGAEPVLQYYRLSAEDSRIVGFCGGPLAGVPRPSTGEEYPDDDLTLVDHIGAKRAQVLNDAGITSHQQIAGMTSDELKTFFPQMLEGPLQECIDSAKRLAGM
jgi:hypothetical protein